MESQNFSSRDENDVVSVIAEYFGKKPDEIAPQTSIDKDLGADSADRIELALTLSEQLDIHIPDSIAESIFDAVNVGQIVAQVSRLFKKSECA